MKTIQFVGSLTITRELLIDAPMQVVASMFNKKVVELESMSQMELEELFMDNIYLIEHSALQLRTNCVDYHDDYVDEQLQELTINDHENRGTQYYTEEVV